MAGVAVLSTDWKPLVDQANNLGLRFADQLEMDAPAIRDEWNEELRQRGAPPDAGPAIGPSHD